MDETKELILDELGKLARLLPEQRFGQIVFNYICAKCSNDDPFFIGDKELLKILETTTQEIENKRKEREIKKIISENPNVIQELYEIVKKCKKSVDKQK